MKLAAWVTHFFVKWWQRGLSSQKARVQFKAIVMIISTRRCNSVLNSSNQFMCDLGAIVICIKEAICVKA